MFDNQVLAQLLHLTGVTEEDFATLKRTSHITQQWVDDFTQAFYDILFSYKPTAAVFKEGERPAREASLKEWYLLVTSGNVANRQFWNHQWYVGIIHIPRKVTNPFMFGMMSRVQQLFLHRCLQECELGEAETTFLAFKRVTDVIAALIAESYHVNYMSAVEHVAGLRPALVEQMMSLEVENMVTEARQKLLN